MSFSQETKSELSRYKTEKSCCKLAELSALIRSIGTIELLGGGMLSLNAITFNAGVARKIFSYFREIFNLELNLGFRKKLNLGKKNFYVVRIPFQPKIKDVLVNLGIFTQTNKLRQGIDPSIVRKKCCRRAYLRGAFLGCGSVSHPEKEYHLEFTTTNIEFGNSLCQLINKEPYIESKTMQRKNFLVIYIKDGNRVVEFLKAIGAYNALCKFENTRLSKDMRNQVNRLINCETANLEKTVQAAMQQTESIIYLRDNYGLEKLKKPLREVAYLRLEHPEASLQELSDLLGNTVSKSGINHRIRRLNQLADQMKSTGGSFE